MKAARLPIVALLLALADRGSAQDVPPAPSSTPVEAPPPSGSDARDAALPPPAASAGAEAAFTEEADAKAADPAAPPSTQPSEVETEVPAAGAPEALSDAELAALGLDMEKQGLDTALHFSGFMDVNMLQLLNPDQAPTVLSMNGGDASFYVGRLNLYMNKNITESFRMMAEVRFMYSPTGVAQAFGSTGGVSAETVDHAGSGAIVRWGGILIERAYGEWSPYPFFNLRLGQFLTPYGIWNVDHGSPAIITVMRPHAVNGTFFPERQTGLEAFGQTGLTRSLTARYHLTLSNGLGPVSEYRDLDSNKAVGGRLLLEHIGRAGTFQIGGAVFYGQNTAGAVSLGVNASGTGTQVQRVINDQADVTAMAADLLWKYRGFHFQSEWVGERREYTNVGRRRVPTAGQGGLPVDAMPPDSFKWAGYALAGYRLPWWGIMPFGTLEYQKANYAGIDTHTAFSQVGLNIRPVDAVVLKLQYQFSFAGTAETRAKFIAAQLAWAF